MPKQERCHCMGVVAPTVNNPPRTCPVVRGDVDGPSDLWFTENKQNITDRDNWTAETLNKLLERVGYCSEY